MKVSFSTFRHLLVPVIFSLIIFYAVSQARLQQKLPFSGITVNDTIVKEYGQTTLSSSERNPSTDFLRNWVRKPVLRAVCMTASMLDFSGRSKKYISNKELREIKKTLIPGDILFRRNDGQLTNIAIPGFWTHSGIYIGGRDEINEYFKNVKMLGGQKPTEYISQHFPQVNHRIFLRKNMIIEAVGDGVTINPLEHFAEADYFAAFRPVINREAVFNALLRAFNYYKTPYDFLFDFRSDDALVCSELVYKSFMADSGKTGINFQIHTLNDKPFLSPNDMARQVINQGNGISSSFVFVTLYSGNNQTGIATKQSEAVFSKYAME